MSGLTTPRDDDDSASGSDHGAECQPPFPDIDRPDLHHSLTSQALNPDGTPKRPMNAFMIFARRRRPQVSQANQMMRTGEISKILSKEWNSMPLSDKQFYLDQAKRLKDTFNSKYPDYVYRRRPNNSRKKRRTDNALGRTFEHGVPTVNPEGDEPIEYEDTSPTDLASALGPDGVGLAEHNGYHHPNHPHLTSLYTAPPAHHAHPHGVSPTYEHSGYAYTNGTSPYHHHPHPADTPDFTRLPSVPSWSPAHDTNGATSPASPGDHYPHHSHHGHSPTVWSTARYDSHTRSSAPSSATASTPSSTTSSAWPMPPSASALAAATSGHSMGLSGHTNGAGRQRALTTIGVPGSILPLNSHKPELFSPQIPHRAWSNTPSSSGSGGTSPPGTGAGVGVGVGGGIGANGTNGVGVGPFQTLTAPFFPGSDPAGNGVNGASNGMNGHGRGGSGHTSPMVHRESPNGHYSYTNGTSNGHGRGSSDYDSYPISPITPPSAGSANGGTYFTNQHHHSNGHGHSSHSTNGYSGSLAPLNTNGSNGPSSRGHLLLQPITTHHSSHSASPTLQGHHSHDLVTPPLSAGGATATSGSGPASAPALGGPGVHGHGYWERPKAEAR